jgi:hypothetical protein
MKLNKQLLQINRNFIICFLISASLSAVTAQILSDFENHIAATITMIVGYVIYFGIFSTLFYLDNRDRYKKMKHVLIRKEIFGLITSFGIAEVVYLAIRWPSLYYFLEVDLEPYIASLISEIISSTLYMISVTVFLRKAKVFG